MRAPLWIVALALAGGGLLWLGWHLLPAPTREGAGPGTLEAAPRRSREPAGLAPVEPAPPNARVSPAPAVEPAAEPVQVVEPPDADGLEEGGLAQAARPLPDFGDKYAGALRVDRVFAAAELERELQAATGALTRAEAEDLEARLARQPVAGEPTPRVAALLARIDELEWLRQQLALPAVKDP